MNLAVCIEVGWSGMLMWNAAFKTEVQKVMWCLKAPHTQSQGWGRLGAEVVQAPHLGRQWCSAQDVLANRSSGVGSAVLDSSGLLGLLSSFSSQDFGRVRVRNVQVPRTGWLLGALTPFCYLGFVVDIRKPLCISVKPYLCHNPEMLDCVYMKVGVCRRWPVHFETLDWEEGKTWGQVSEGLPLKYLFIKGSETEYRGLIHPRKYVKFGLN